MNTKEMILACAASSLGEGAKRASELGKKGSAFLVSLMLLLVISSGAEAAERDEIVFFMPDALGSAVVAVGEAGQPCWSESYTPYGSKTLDEDVWPENTGCGIAGAERGFTGHTEDVATDLTYMKHRFYDPSIGRFLSVDPLDADPTKPLTFNRYAYANNNPHRFVDPDGRLRVLVVAYWAAATALTAYDTHRSYQENGFAGAAGSLAVDAALSAVGGKLVGSALKNASRVVSPAATTAAKQSDVLDALEPTVNQLDAFSRQLREHWATSLRKSQRKLQRRLDKHREDLKEYESAGGHTSSVEREIRNFERGLKAIDEVLENAE